MIFDHDVKFDGVWYKAGTEVPVSADNTASESKNNEVAEETLNIENETKPKRSYTRKKVD